jgi:hypothetical protein
MNAPTRRGLLGGAAVLAAAPIIPSVAATNPDATLLRLGAELDTAYAAENEAWTAAGDVDDDHPMHVLADKLGEVTGGIVDLIEAERAATLAGLLVKTRAVRWCRTGDAAGPEIFGRYPWINRSLATDERLIISLMADLYTMVGGPAA